MTQFIFILFFFITYLFLIPWKYYFLNLELNRGNRLLLSVYILEEEVYCGRIPTISKNLNYKFFSTLLESFLLYSRHFGIPIFNFLGEFRQHLGRDLEMEKKLFKEIRDGIIQFFFVGGISFGFWRFSHFFLDLKAAYTVRFFFALFLEFIGLIIYLIFFYIGKNKLLKSFNALFRSYYLFWGLSSVGLPVVEVLGESQILEQSPSEAGQRALQRRVESLVNSWKEVGLPVKSAMEDAILELWNLYNVRFQVFRRNLKIVNFLIMALFYLSAFFILLMDLMGLFLIEIK